ncbi:Interactor of ZYG-11 family protein [Acanthocheilonema viteae]
MVTIRAIGEMYIEITGLMATFWACNVVMKYLYYHQANSSFLNEFIAVLLCYVVIPIITLVNIIHPEFSKIWQRSRILRKSKILFFTIIEGILSGYILSDREYHQTPPTVWFVPLGIAFATSTKYFNIGACPEKLLFISVGLGAINQLVFGLIVGITFSYLCISAVYAVIGFLAVQFYIKKYREEKKMHELYQMSYILANVYAELFLNYIFAYSL